MDTRVASTLPLSGRLPVGQGVAGFAERGASDSSSGLAYKCGEACSLLLFSGSACGLNR